MTVNVQILNIVDGTVLGELLNVEVTEQYHKRYITTNDELNYFWKNYVVNMAQFWAFFNPIFTDGQTVVEID